MIICPSIILASVSPIEGKKKNYIFPTKLNILTDAKTTSLSQRKAKIQTAISQGRGRGINEGSLMTKPLRVSLTPLQGQNWSIISHPGTLFHPFTPWSFITPWSILGSECCKGEEASSESPQTSLHFYVFHYNKRALFLYLLAANNWQDLQAWNKIWQGPREVTITVLVLQPACNNSRERD